VKRRECLSILRERILNLNSAAQVGYRPGNGTGDAMADYRLYKVRDNRIYADVRISAKCHAEAVQIAQATLSGESGELWHGDVRINIWRGTK